MQFIFNLINIDFGIKFDERNNYKKYVILNFESEILNSTNNKSI